MNNKPVEKDSSISLKKLSFWGIRLKLVLIISSVISVSLSSMIYLATYFFRADYERRIQEQNIKLVEVVGVNLESTLKNLIEQSRFLARTYSPKQS